MAAPRIGYVGLGNMGGALARRLQRQCALQVFDPIAASVQRLVDEGATACASLPELAARSDIVFLCLPTSNQVRDALFGTNGLAASMKPGTLVVDQTTGDPNATREFARELATRGVDLIDAPVSGGAAGADAGTIAIMVGAEAAQLERVQPILAAISPNVFHAGGVGAGHVMKLVNNLLSGAQRMLSFEAVSLAAKCGLDPRRACEILIAGGARNAFLEKSMLPQILKGNLSPGFTLGLMHKDLKLACDMGSTAGVPMFYGNVTRELLQLCIGEHGADAQLHVAALVFDRLAGTQVVPGQSPKEP